MSDRPDGFGKPWTGKQRSTVAKARYTEALRGFPPSGGGGCHTALLSVANYGRLAGHTPQQVFFDLRQVVHGSRYVPDQEIQQAVRKAFADDAFTGVSAGFQQRAYPDVQRLLEGIMERGKTWNEDRLREASPVKLSEDPVDDAILLIEHIYERTWFLFMGDLHGADVCPASAWIAAIRNRRYAPEHFLPNPLTGQFGLTKDGTLSFRADDCVSHHMLAIGEFDRIPEALRSPEQIAAAEAIAARRYANAEEIAALEAKLKWPQEQQLKFWAGSGLPVAAIIDSGGKSLHALIRISGVTTAAQWEKDVKRHLFGRLLVPLGVDPKCSNASRLTRMPGHIREATGRRQRLLYLDPEGKAVMPL